jgi:hypothetical protein
VSGYTTISNGADSMTIILVNRDLSASRTAAVNITGFSVSNGNYKILELSSLPSGETFISHTSNALKSRTVAVSGNSFNITLPSVSTTAVILTGTGTGIDRSLQDMSGLKSLGLYPNPTSGMFKIHIDDQISGDITLKLTDLEGKTVLIREVENNSEINLSETGLASGLYVITAENHGHSWCTKLVYTARK